MRCLSLLSALALATLLLPLPLAAAGGPAAVAPSPAPIPPAPGTAAARGLESFLASFSGGISAQSTCTAHCWDGSSVTCSGSSCSAQDSHCPDVRGSCTGSTSGTKTCPRCPLEPRPCSASIVCDDGTQLFCTGQSCASQPHCSVVCDGNQTFCPGIDPDQCLLAL